MMLLSGCQIGYLAKSAYSQANLLRKRIPVEDALKDSRLTDDQKRKLSLAQDARAFAEAELGLSKTKNYTSYVQLDGPYVTYVVSAAPKDELKPHLWKYPLVGAMPYKGFFEPKGAEDEAAALRAEGLDTYVRGVTAYSTLGWFRDPILSSMLAYKDHDLVNTIIHETVHATLFVKSEADFNERLATFIGNKGTDAYYLKREGPQSPTLALMKKDTEDDKVFAEFMKRELKSLEEWYAEKKAKGPKFSDEERLARIKEIQDRFKSEVKPKLSSKDSYSRFETAELNNARLLNYRLYFEDLSQFDKVFVKLGSDFSKMLEFCKSLEKSDDPVAELKKAAE
ncbi:MAG: aminopeptidase [Bdellovibrionota bacterium]